MAGLIPGAVFVEVPGRDHLPFVGDQESILNPIQAFVHNLGDDLTHDRSLATVLVAGIGTAHQTLFPEKLSSELAARVSDFLPSALRYNTTEVVLTFDGPARAVHAAEGVLQIARQRGFEAGVGLHTGECMTGGAGSLSGSAVKIAKRLQEWAPPGDIFVSGTVRDLVPGAGLLFEPRGRIEQGDTGEWQVLRLIPRT